MLKTLSISLVLALAACGGSKAAEPTGPTTTATASAVTLELGELKLIDVNKNQSLTIQADGTIVIPAQPDGDAGGTLKVTTDGKIVKADTGEVGLQLMPDGTIQSPDGKVLDVTLSADAVITSGDKKISLDDKGMLVGSNPEAPQMRIEGATTLGLKRTALFVLIALTSGEPREAPPPTEVPPPTTPAG
jgi:hypothetical protein